MHPEWAAKIPSIRSYVFAFEASDAVTKILNGLLREWRISRRSLATQPHLYGLFIVGRGFLYTKPVDVAKAVPEDFFHIRYTTDHPLLAFKTSLLQGLARFPRPQIDWVPAID